MADLYRFPTTEKIVELPQGEFQVAGRLAQRGTPVLDLSDGAGEFSLLRFHRAVRALCFEPRTFTDDPNPDAA